jgi:hypothetical protein
MRTTGIGPRQYSQQPPAIVVPRIKTILVFPSTVLIIAQSISVAGNKSEENEYKDDDGKIVHLNFSSRPMKFPFSVHGYKHEKLYSNQNWNGYNAYAPHKKRKWLPRIRQRQEPRD